MTTSTSPEARLIADLEARRPAALARAISIVENQRQGFDTILGALHAKIGRGRRIGITGPPGAGKSTVTTQLAAQYREAGLTVGIIAVDPTSPFTGGALLGDRIRMESVALDPGVYIRSLATRGSLGGLSSATRAVADVLDAYGFDRILMETVGVGQGESPNDVGRNGVGAVSTSRLLSTCGRENPSLKYQQQGCRHTEHNQPAQSRPQFWPCP